MPDNVNDVTNASDDIQQDEQVIQPDAPQEQEEQVADTEEVATDEAQAIQDESSEELDINEYVQERYQTPQQTQNNSMVDEVARELSQLPADEDGNVDANAAAKWFSERLSQAENSATERAIQAANNAVMGNLSEVAQQQKLLEKHPDLTKDRERLDAVFDLRDAAALRGQNLTLLQAAAKLDKFRQADTAQGAQSATRRTTIQAAAHLETSSSKGSGAPQGPINLGDKETRHALLKQHVQNEIESGRIQLPN